jgi:transporter family-2 protein
MTLIMILLAVCGGATLSIQAAINGQLGSSVGVFKSAFLTFSVGALVTALLIFFFEPKQAVTLLDVPKWQLLGAMFGVPYCDHGRGGAAHRHRRRHGGGDIRPARHEYVD